MYIIWDIETRGLGGPLVIGEVYARGQAYTFTTWDQFYNIISRPGLIPDKSIFMAHNGGKYDNKYILSTFKKYGCHITNLININGSVVFTVNVGGKRFYFRDSFLVLPRSLKSLCEAFGVKQAKKAFNMPAWISSGCPITQELKEYLHYDCLALEELLGIFQAEIGNPKLTLASTAFSILLDTQYNGQELKTLLHNWATRDQERFIREAYKGGRVEVFNQHGQDLYKYDVNSLYPYCMRDFDYPYGALVQSQDPDQIKHMINKGFLGVVRCSITCPDMDIPYLPKRHENKLIFPVGSWEDTITTYEYLKAVDLGYTIKIHEGIIYRKKGKVFKQYVDKYYHIKQTAKGAKKEIAKLLLNSAYGKFGQRREVEEYYTFDEMLECQKPISDFVQMNDELYTTNTESYRNRKINPIIACFVTAYARTVLYDCLKWVTDHGGEVYYCDTDSVFCDIPLPPEMVHKDRLGAWKDELNGSRLKDAVFISPKLYSMVYADDSEEVKAKGVPRDQAGSIKHNSMLDLKGGCMWFMWSPKMVFEDERITGFKEHWKLSSTDKTQYIGKIKTKKVITGDYNKRIMDSKGRTVPIRV